MDVSRKTRLDDMHERAAAAGELCASGRPAVLCS